MQNTQTTGRPVFVYRETTPRRAARRAYHLLDEIASIAEKMEGVKEEGASVSDLVLDIAGWGEKIRTLAELAIDEIYPISEEE